MDQWVKVSELYMFQDQSGKINLSELREACQQFNLPVEPELLVQLMDYCDKDRDGQINYIEFANFLNWKDKIPSGFPPQSGKISCWVYNAEFGIFKIIFWEKNDLNWNFHPFQFL